MLEQACIVIDTNVALDLWIYKDPRTEELSTALKEGQLRWIATESMREELKRVLDYTHILARMQTLGLSRYEVLEQFDALVELREDSPKAVYTCKDPDDQKFIDLAAQYQVPLISKDKCVLSMKNRMMRLNVAVTAQWSNSL